MAVLIPEKPDSEKRNSIINVRCSKKEKQSWLDSFGGRDVSATVRRLLNAAAAKKLKRAK